MAHSKKQPKSIERPGKKRVPESRNQEVWKNKYPVWRFSRFDKDHEKWGIKDIEYNKILEKLSEYERMTWNDIEASAGGRAAGTNSHFITADKLIKEARNRLQSLKLEEFSDSIFSLRLNSKHRLFGILMGGTFDIIWDDKKHEICPGNKR